jgi:fibronectin type 3 domain-containing protein
MTYGFWSRLVQVGLVGVVTLVVGFGGCGRERANPIDPSFQGSEALSPPSNIAAVGDIGQIRLTWNAINSTNLAGYGVWRSTSATGNFERLTGEAADTAFTTSRTTYIDSTLISGSSSVFFYKVNTIDLADRSSALSAFVSAEVQVDNRPPAAPGDLSVVLDEVTSQVTLAWTGPLTDVGSQLLTGVQEYKVFRSKNSTDAFVLVATVSTANGTQYTDREQLDPEAQYFYRVSAIDASGNESSRSSVAGFSGSSTAILAAPANLRAVGAIGQIVVSWTAVNDPNLLGYLVFRSTTTTGTFNTITADTLFTTGQTEYIDQSVVPQTVYYYKIQTVIQDPELGLIRSIVSSFKDGQSLEDETPPAAPTDLIVSLDDNNFKSVSLTWTPPTQDSNGGDLTGLVSYRIFRSRDTGNSFVLLTTISSTQAAYQDTSVELLTRYFYTVSAVDGASNVGTRSASVSVTTKGLATPSNLVATSGVQKITLRWNANTEPELTGYEVLRFNNPTDASPNATIPSILTTYVDTPVTAGQTFVYRVRAVGVNNLQSDASNFASAQANEAPPVLAAPRNVTATGSIGQITVTWSANTESELTGYRVLKYTDPSETTALATFSSVKTSLVDSPLAEGQTFVYRVQAIGTGGVSSDPSLFASATTLVDDSAPATPSPFAAVLNGSTTIQLSWSAPRKDSNGSNLTGLSSFVIYRAVGSANAGLTALAAIDSTRRTYEDGSLEFNTTYIYQISAFDANGNESSRSSSVTLTTATQGASVAAPTNLSANYNASATPPDVTLAWTTPASFDSFLIQRATLSDGSSSPSSFTTLALSQTGTSYVDTSILGGVTYVYRVSTNLSGQISDPSLNAVIPIP